MAKPSLSELPSDAALREAAAVCREAEAQTSAFGLCGVKIVAPKRLALIFGAGHRGLASRFTSLACSRGLATRRTPFSSHRGLLGRV